MYGVLRSVAVTASAASALLGPSMTPAGAGAVVAPHPAGAAEDVRGGGDGTLIRDAEYQLGHVPEEPAEEWTSIVIDITDAHGERFYKEVTRDEVEVATARAQAAEPVVIRGPSSPTA
jgi:hypothetical protein